MDDTYEHPETLEPTPPLFLVDIWNQGTEFLASYGWYLLGLGLVILYYWERIQTYLDQRYKQQSEKEYEARCKKDPDWLLKRQQEMEAARKRMQEELDRKAALHAAKMKEREEQRRAELLASAPEGGHRLGTEAGVTASVNKTETASTTKKNYRPEYHPLMGGGSSGGYRPPRRGCPGGGCG